MSVTVRSITYAMLALTIAGFGGQVSYLPPRRYAVDAELIKEIGFLAWDDKETVCP